MKDLKLNLVKRSPSLYGNAPCFDVMQEFESTINENYSELSHVNYNHSFSPLIYKLLVARFGIPVPKSSLFKKNFENYFSIQMGPDFGKILPFCCKSKNTYAYFFDIWPNFFNETEKFLSNSSLNQAFLSSRYATEFFSKKGFKNVTWVPEGVSSHEYTYLSYSEKDIDVLELGRKHQSVHNKILGPLMKSGKLHLYEKVFGQSVFVGKESFIAGMARSKISICFPKNETHPDVAGPVSTMTNRYLQSMASKCLVVGSAPDEMKQLFGYSPVVHLNSKNPGEHLLDILDHYEDYEELVEKNYNNVIENHTWKNRWDEIFKIIKNSNLYN